MKNSFVRSVFLVMLLAAMTICGGFPVSAMSEEPVDDVSLVTKMNGGREHAVIIATDADGLPVWTVRTEQYDAAQLSAFADIGVWQDQYYYVERGKVVCLDLHTGSKKWENSDFGGAPTQYCHLIKEDGTVYLSGYFGPDFYAVDRDGNTLGKVDQLDPNYFWPVGLNVTEDTVYLRMEGTPDGTETEISRSLRDCLTSGAAPAAGTGVGSESFAGLWECDNNENSTMTITQAADGGYEAEFFFYRISNGYGKIDGELSAGKTVSISGTLNDYSAFSGTLEVSENTIVLTVTASEFDYIPAGDVYIYSRSGQ